MSIAGKSMLALGLGLFAGISLWLWQTMGEEVFLTRVLAIAQNCF